MTGIAGSSRFTSLLKFEVTIHCVQNSYLLRGNAVFLVMHVLHLKLQIFNVSHFTMTNNLFLSISEHRCGKDVERSAVFQCVINSTKTPWRTAHLEFSNSSYNNKLSLPFHNTRAPVPLRYKSSI